MLKETTGQADSIPKGPAMLSASLFMKVYLPPILGVHSLQAYCMEHKTTSSCQLLAGVSSLFEMEFKIYMFSLVSSRGFVF